jgi:thiol-disulfide isomerase/thioredoxin
VLELPNGRQEPKKHEYGVGKDGGAFLALSSGGKEIMRFVAGEGRMTGTQLNVDGRYAEVAYQEDFADALRRIGGEQAQVTAPPAVVAAQGGDLRAFVEALRFGVLAPLEITGFQPAAAQSEPALVTLQAANGRLILGLDSMSHRPREVRMALGEGKQQVRATGRYTFTPGDPGDALQKPDLTGRTATPDLAALGAGAYPLGQPAPKVALRSFDGGTVRPGDLGGSVVVLDFWATWCVPCWTALRHTAELAAWAESSGLPVKVFAVDTLENTKDPEEQRRQVAELLRAKKLALPVLLDQGNEAFSAFHNPGLPSLVIIGRDGRLARYHSGLLRDMVTTVRGEVMELLKQ